MPTKTRTKETDRFHAVADDGEQFTIIEYTEQVGVDRLGSHETQWRDSLKDYQAVGAGGVNKISDQEFEIVSRDKVAKRA